MRRLLTALGLAVVLVAVAATVALQNIGPLLVEGASRPLYFAGARSVTIPAREHVVSDPVSLSVHAGETLAVSLHVPGSDVRSNIHGNALTASYLTASAAGDQTGTVGGAAFNQMTT